MKELSRAEIKAANIPREIRATFELIKEPLANVEERIRAQAREFDPAVEGYVAYACESSGKRLRPALVLLAAGATGGVTPVHLELAVILELIHAATLVHDDIMDGAEIGAASRPSTRNGAIRFPCSWATACSPTRSSFPRSLPARR